METTTRTRASPEVNRLISAGMGVVHPWLILGLSFVAGRGFGLNDPAWHASVGHILDTLYDLLLCLKP
nr:MFS transporter [Mesorhizobium sp. WSM3862]